MANIDSAGLLSPSRLGASGSEPPATEGLEFNSDAMWGAIKRNRLIVIIVPLLALLAGVAVTLLTPRQYRATATVQIEQQSAKVLSSGETETAAAAQESDRFLQTQIGLLNSKALAIRVVDSLALAKDDSALEALGVSAKTRDRLGDVRSRREALGGLVRGGVSVSLPRDSRIAQVSFTGRDPELAARIANSYVGNFIVYNLQRRFNESSYALNFLRQQLDAAKKRLQDSEKALVNYASRARLVDTGGAGAATRTDLASPTLSSLNDINTSLSVATAERIRAEQRWNEAQKTPLLSQPEVLQSTAYQALVERRAIAQAEYQQERLRHKPDYPSMTQASAQIAELNAQIQQIATSARDSLRNQYQVAVRNEEALRSRLDVLKTATFSEQGLSIEYNILRREVDTSRTMYDGLLQRYKEVSAAAGVTANNISAVDSADVPSSPVSPKLRMNLASAAVIGIMLALLIVIVRERFSDVVNTPAEVAQKLGVPLLGPIPRSPKRSSPSRELMNLRSPISEAAVTVRTALELSAQQNGRIVLLISSSNAREGKSSLAYALSSDFARAGRKVVLVDGDLRKQDGRRSFGEQQAIGLSNVLTGGATLEEALQPGDEEGLDYILAGPVPPNPTQLLSSTQLTETIADLRRRYAVVILDGPPVLQLADAVLLASAAGAVVFVVEAAVTKAGAARTALNRLRSSGARIAGAVLTKFDAPAIDYTYE